LRPPRANGQSDSPNTRVMRGAGCARRHADDRLASASLRPSNSWILAALPVQFPTK